MKESEELKNKPEQAKEIASSPPSGAPRNDAAAAQLNDRLLRLGAEFENYKKRVQREREDLIKYVGESFLMELLSIVDNFERAFQAADTTKDFKVLHQGVEMILKEVENFLKENGVKKMNTVGEQFDPHKHEAIEQVARAEGPENIIVEELQAGYELNGRVIRPARVKVSKKTDSTDEPKDEGRGTRDEKEKK